MDETVISSVLDQNYGGNDLDSACLQRLKDLAKDYGENGETALELLAIVQRLIEI